MLIMDNCPAKFVNLIILFHNVNESRLWLLTTFGYWSTTGEISRSHMRIRLWTFSFPKRTSPLQIRAWEWNGKMMSSNEQTEERVSKGFIQRSVTAPLILATCSNTQTSINNSSSGPRSLTHPESAVPAGVILSLPALAPGKR